MKWVSLDPECGAYVDYDQASAEQLANEFPEQYACVPDWLALLLRLTARLHGKVQGMTYEYKIRRGDGSR